MPVSQTFRYTALPLHTHACIHSILFQLPSLRHGDDELYSSIVQKGRVTGLRGATGETPWTPLPQPVPRVKTSNL